MRERLTIDESRPNFSDMAFTASSRKGGEKGAKTIAEIAFDRLHETPYSLLFRRRIPLEAGFGQPVVRMEVVDQPDFLLILVPPSLSDRKSTRLNSSHLVI